MTGEWTPRASVRALYGVGASALAVLMLALAVGSVVAVASGTSAAILAALIVYVPTSWVAFRLAAGVWRSHVSITADSVVVVGPWRTQSLPLEQVDRFEAGRYGTASAAVFLVRKPGAEARHGLGPRGRTLLWATQRGGTIANFDAKVRSLEPLATDMNAALAAARSQAN